MRVLLAKSRKNLQQSQAHGHGQKHKRQTSRQCDRTPTAEHGELWAQHKHKRRERGKGAKDHAERDPVSASANINAGATQPMISYEKSRRPTLGVSASAAAPRGNRAYSKLPKWFALAKKPTPLPKLVKA